jgi:hypothetical protein
LADWLKVLRESVRLVIDVAILLGLVYALAVPNPATHTRAVLEAVALAALACLALFWHFRRRRP